jgi:Na+/alanine symporter
VNWFIIVPLAVFFVVGGLLIARTRGSILGRHLPVQTFGGLLIGVVAGAFVIALNYDIVPDEIEIALTGAFTLASVAAGALLLRYGWARE